MKPLGNPNSHYTFVQGSRLRTVQQSALLILAAPSLALKDAGT